MQTPLNESGLAYSPREFGRRNAIGLTTVYEELKAGRLTARKIGRRTIVLASDEAKWRDALPVIGRA